MALSLTAEQKNISSLFYNEDQYIIPEFQRPYCWTTETAYQLYTDIMTYYRADEDFFVGNIVVARSDDQLNKPQVVDGQQRIITLWLWMKSLMLLVPSMGKLKEGVELNTWEDDTEYIPKVKSKVIDSLDPDELDYIWKLNAEGVEKMLLEHQKYKKSHIYSNFLDIYSILKEAFSTVQDSEKRKFIKFFIYKVFLLPIELKGRTIEEANDRALMIFETINNRGQNLEDADIFKAKLYNKAVSVNKKDDFLNRWICIKEMCVSLDISIEDLFKFYSHILRGEQGIISFETSLRDFFLKGPNAPILIADYQDVTDKLSHILEVLQKIEDDMGEMSDLGMWLKIIRMYSNQYPMFAVVSYLYVNGKDENYVNFLKLLVRVCYSYGSSTTVKFIMYKIIADVFSGEIRSKESSDYWVPNFENLRSRRFIKNGLILLAYYLVVGQPVLGKPRIERILRPSAKMNHVDDNIKDLISQLGNFFVIDVKSDIFVNEYNKLYFDFKNKNIGSAQILLSRVKERTDFLSHVLFDFLSDNQ